MSPNSFSYLLTFGFLALFVTGCGGDTSKPSNSASPSPSTSAAASSAPVASSAPSFTQPVVAASPSVSPVPEVAAAKSESMAAALLPASNSETIIRNTSKGRTDPFASVVFQSVVETKPNPNGTTRVASSSTVAAPSSSNAGNYSTAPIVARAGSTLGLAGAAANASKDKAPANNATAVRPRPIPNGALDSAPRPGRPPVGPKQPPLVPVDPGPVAIRSLPPQPPSVDVPPQIPLPAPQPTYASNIAVSGVAQVNGQTQVILRLPNESFSRYVSVGERVMDGKVLVKRVENPNATTPVVVLEEVGTEVPRKVGDKVAPVKEGTR